MGVSTEHGEMLGSEINNVVKRVGDGTRPTH